MKEQLAIDCQACHAPKFMFATKVPRFHGVVRIIGVVLVIKGSDVDLFSGISRLVAVFSFLAISAIFVAAVLFFVLR